MNEQSVGIIGVGRLGSDVAFTLAEQDVCDIVLYDLDRDRAAYLASDLTDTSFGRVYNRRVSWVEEMHELAHCGVILLTAGARRGPDTTLRDIHGENRALARLIAESFVGSSNLFVVASEPVDLITAELARLLHLPPSRVMGIGGVVDSYRVRYALGEELEMSPDYIRAHVIGPHDSDVGVLWDYSSINGVPVREIAPAQTLATIERSLRAAAASNLQQLNDSTSRYTPAAACLELLRSIVKDDRRILSVTMPWTGTFGITGVAMSIPAVVGRFGAERPLSPNPDEEIRARVLRSAETYSAILGETDR